VVIVHDNATEMVQVSKEGSYINALENIIFGIP
jgi:hypothetical protein